MDADLYNILFIFWSKVEKLKESWETRHNYELTDLTFHQIFYSDNFKDNVGWACS
jgi:hypothetical protein